MSWLHQLSSETFGPSGTRRTFILFKNVEPDLSQKQISKKVGKRLTSIKWNVSNKLTGAFRQSIVLMINHSLFQLAPSRFCDGNLSNCAIHVNIY